VSEFFQTYDHEITLRDTFEREGQINNLKITNYILDRMVRRDFLLIPSTEPEVDETMEDQIDLDVMEHTESSNDLINYMASQGTLVPLFEEEIR